MNTKRDEYYFNDAGVGSWDCAVSSGRTLFPATVVRLVGLAGLVLALVWICAISGT